MNEQLTEKKKIINCLYSHFKDNTQKLKIVCDWDEVIQPHEPYALWLTPLSEKQKKDNYIDEKVDFSEYFEVFWAKKEEPWINYSPYGSRLMPFRDTEKLNRQQEIKNSPEFYRQAPFLTITKELLKLIKENKVEKLIFLSAYDKRKFPNGDPRKSEIFNETFGKFANCSLELIGFDSEEKGANKADWIKENASDFNVVIDDNPNICKNIAEGISNTIVCTPHYPALENQHHEKVLLIKTNVSDLDKGDFIVNKGKQKITEKDSFLSDCCQIIIKEYHVLSNKDIIQANYSCPKCGKYIKIYPNQKKAKEMDDREKEETLFKYWKKELSKRGYYVIKDTEYSHHGEIILRALQEDLSSLEMKILGEVKGDQAIIYLQPESCCSLSDEYEREPIKLPLIQLPANTKGIKYFDYFPFSWKYPTWGQDEEAEKGTLQDIWRNRDKSSPGIYFPKAKTELMERLKNKGFQWEGGGEKDNYLKAICPRCGWVYNCELTEKYMKAKEQKEMTKTIKNHEC